MNDGEFESTFIQGKGARRKYYKGMLSFVEVSRRVHILWTTEIMLGREDTCDIFIDDKRVSRKHAFFSLGFDGVRFADLSSSNGSTRNCEKVEGTILLNNGDEIGIGGAFNLGIKIRELDDMVQSVVIGVGEDEYLLTQTDVLIGSSPTAVDVLLPDPAVVDVHAQLEFIYDTPIITAIREDQPIVVDKQIVRSTRLKEYSAVRIGNTHMTWRL